MSHITLGIDINHHSLRYAICQVNGLNQNAELLVLDEIPVTATEADDGLDAAFEALSVRIGQQKNVNLDAIGLSLDPTVALRAHRLFSFNDPHLVEQVLKQTMADVWKVDEDAQLSFEIGEYVEGKGGEGEEGVSGGYDVHVLNYPHEKLRSLLERLKKYRIEPNVALPSTDALRYSMETAIRPPGGVWAIIDINEHSSTFTVCEGSNVKMTRPVKIGSSVIDEALMEAYSISPEDAKLVKESSGFVAMDGEEMAMYEKLLSLGAIKPLTTDPVAFARTCGNALSAYMTAIRQTIGNFVIQNRCEPEIVFLVGGGAKMAGLAEWFSRMMDVRCEVGLPMQLMANREYEDALSMDVDSVAIAVASAAAIDNKCPLNLRRGDLAHKGSLSYLIDNKWIIASCIVAVLAMLIFMTVTKAKSIHEEHEKLKAALEETSQAVFGKKLMTYNQIDKEISESEGFSFIPVRTAFSHFMWISNNVNDNLADVEMDLNSIDINNQLKIVTIRGEVVGDEGLPKFIQLLEQYECFPNEIQEPKTTKVKDKTTFTLKIDAANCRLGGDSE